MNEYESQVIERLVRMETKIDYMTQRIDSHESRITLLEKEPPNADHEDRLRKLERYFWIAFGAAATSGGAAGAALTQILGG